MDVSEKRADAALQAIKKIKSVLQGEGLNRGGLELALQEIRGLADKSEYWSDEHFPAPDMETRQARYLIQEDPDRTFALYLNVMQPGRVIPPHNHTTWACVAGVDGEEHNFVYRRVDDGKTAGHARLELSDLVVVGPGTGIALMPDDIHSVEIRGEKPIRHLHMYGRALETLSERLVFDIDAQTCKPMPMGVQTKR